MPDLLFLWHLSLQDAALTLKTFVIFSAVLPQNCPAEKS